MGKAQALGALLAWNRHQLRFVVGRQRAHETGMTARLGMPPFDRGQGPPRNSTVGQDSRKASSLAPCASASTWTASPTTPPPTAKPVDTKARPNSGECTA
jgi:hypothetical protein